MTDRSSVDPCPESVFFLNRSLPSSPPPSISVAPGDTLTSRGAEKAKNPAMEGDGRWNNQRGGRKERGRSEERRGMRQKKGARCLCLATECSSHFLFGAGSGRGQTRKKRRRRRSQIKVPDEVSLSLAGVFIDQRVKELAGFLFGQRVSLSARWPPTAALWWLLVHPSNPSPPGLGVACHLNPTPRLAGLCSKVP